MKKILVVDDDPDILEAVDLVLKTEGFDSLAIARGDETLKNAKKFKPDLIILDMLLSGSDGRNVCRELKGNNVTKKIPVIMISAHPTAKESTKLSGAESFLPKPFSINTLLQEVHKYL